MIRPTTHEDALGFLELEALCFEMNSSPDTRYFWTPMVEYSWSFKAEIGKKIIGGVISLPTRDGNWYVNSLFVHPDYRRRGVASMLLGEVIRVSEGRPILLDVKTDRPSLLRFYGKFGFALKEKMLNYYRDNSDRYLLERPGRRVKGQVFGPSSEV